MIRFLRFLIRILLRLIAHIEIYGKDNVPLTGGMILSSNHIGILDIIMVYYGIERTDIFIPVAEKRGHDTFFLMQKALYLLFFCPGKQTPGCKPVLHTISWRKVRLLPG